MTDVLLDTNALVWLISDPDQINDPARTVLADSSTMLYVSAASAWEIAMKTKLGKIENGQLLVANWGNVLTGLIAEDIPITSDDAILAGTLNITHKDPFDRMIIAQAARRTWSIATSDAQVRRHALTPVITTSRT
jgi:PIN domain nuclease of toxin-antitoxin system